MSLTKGCACARQRRGKPPYLRKPRLAEATAFFGLMQSLGFLQNPAGVAALNLIPAANVAVPDLADSNTYVSSPVIQDTVDLLTIKLDRQTGSNNTFSGHYSLFNENSFNPFDPVNAFTDLPGYGSTTINRGQNAGFTWTHVFNSHWVNEARLGFNRLRAADFQQDSGINLSAATGIPDRVRQPCGLGIPQREPLWLRRHRRACELPPRPPRQHL